MLSLFECHVIQKNNFPGGNERKKKHCTEKRWFMKRVIGEGLDRLAITVYLNVKKKNIK